MKFNELYTAQYKTFNSQFIHGSVVFPGKFLAHRQNEKIFDAVTTQVLSQIFCTVQDTAAGQIYTQKC